MSAPRLNRQMVLEAPETVSDGAGGFTQGWVPLGMIWAEVSPRSGREMAQNGAAVSRMSYRIIVRAAPVGDEQRPAAQQRFREGSRIFNIDAVAEHGMGGRYLQCWAQEEQVV
ncbi:SPP1 family predicted phage head-tail adaptor [Sulfitobacter undariae]|uniref:SPP1 family predicted phage head-tail adaptor n=1 Tax=Sulfitobacter undariae TaxID=1563671 RepID=A0A7W6E9X2_9RHOB|nr:phage head closure protein [Sulfitobacter undariae]MBB3994695.1 SPP1 family predicted phage head-tail adaptor [Sulfitobacter undariae]